MLQTLCYDYLYKNSQKLKENEVQTFLLSSRTPQKSTLKKFGWHPADKPGVYLNRNPFGDSLILLLLNELEDSPHNAWIKCFASRQDEKKSAFETLRDKNFSSLHRRLQWFIEGLLHYLFATGGKDMEIEVTPEDVMKVGKKWRMAALSGMTAKERLAGLAPKDRLAGLAPGERKNILAEFTAEELEDYLKKLKKQKRKMN